MQVLADAASREAELQPAPAKPQLLRRLVPGPAQPQPRPSGGGGPNHKLAQAQLAQLKHIQHKIVPGVAGVNVLKSSTLTNIPATKFVLAQQQQQQPKQQVQQQAQLAQQQAQLTQQIQLQRGHVVAGSTAHKQMLLKISKPLLPGKQAQAKPAQPRPLQQQPGQPGPAKQPGTIKTIKPLNKNHLHKPPPANAPKSQPLAMAQAQAQAQAKLQAKPQVKTQTKPQTKPLTKPLAKPQAKHSIKTLLPQQSVVVATQIAGTALLHKLAGQPISVQSQPMMQHKQIVVASASGPQALRTLPSIKTLVPLNVIEPKKETDVRVEVKNEVKPEIKMELAAEIKTEIKQEDATTSTSQIPSSSPQRRMPLPYECLQFVLQDHNYGAPPPRTPPPQSPPPQPVKQQPVNGAGNPCVTTQHSHVFNPVTPVISTPVEDDAASAISSEAGREVEPEGEETETAPEGEGDDEDSVTRCICDFEHDDGYMICCDRCFVWQHVDCMGIDRSNIPDEYLCEICRPRRVDRARARALQMRKREELLNSDTSSDTSSSSADTDVNVNANAKNRKGSQQQQSGPRRKSDPPSQVRRLNNNNNNNNNNNLTKRQRRDTNSRQASGVRNKKETTNTTASATTAQQQTTKQQRGPGKRKTKRRASLEDKEDEAQDAWGSNMAPLRHWIERYEEAVTNHYSPELRARISSIKVNGTHNDLKQSNIGTVANGKCRLNIQSNNLRYLVSTMHLPPNTPVVELRGKYMLSTQHRPSTQQGRQHAQRPGPFVFFYRLPRDGTEVCVDTRTYGNEARFVRRSCKPNAEVKHCIEKGILHLYIVTTAAVEKNAEITIRHDQHDLMLSPNSNNPIPLICACNSTKDCQLANVNTTTPSTRRGNNGPLAENTDGRERRRRGRRNTVCEDNNVETPATTTSATITPVVASATPPPTVVTVTPPPSCTKKSVTINSHVSVKEIPVTNNTHSSASTTAPATTRSAAKEEHSQALAVQPQSSSSISTSTSTNTNTSTSISAGTSAGTSTSMGMGTSTNMSTSASASASAITSAVAGTSAGTSTVKGAGAGTSTSTSIGTGTSTGTSVIQSSTKSSIATQSTTSTPASDTKKDKKKMTREERKMEAIMKAFERLEKAEQRKQEVQARNAQRKESGGGHSDNEDSSGHTSGKPSRQNSIDKAPRRKKRKGRTRSTSNSQSHGTRRTRLNSAESDFTSGDESNSMQSPPLPNQNCSYGLRIHGTKEQNSSGNSQAAAGLLLALANSSVTGSSSPPQHHQPTPVKSPNGDSGASSSSQSSTPSTPLSSACLLVAAAVGPLAPGFKFPKTKKHLMNEWLKEAPEPQSQGSEHNAESSEFLSQNYAAKGLATLVQAAHSVSAICDSPPQKLTNSAPSGSAKKRWLRQAISEECDSPNSSRPESPPSEMVAPPKKRRIARESLSSDNYTPPTTPTMQQDHMPAHRPSVNEDDFLEHMPSPSTEDPGSQNEFDLDQAKDEAKSKFSLRERIDQKIGIVDPVTVNSILIKQERLSPLCSKIKEERMSEEEESSSSNAWNSIKTENNDIIERKLTPKSSIKTKTDSHFDTSQKPKLDKKPVQVEEIIQRGTVEIVDQNDLENDDLSSPIAAMESDTELKKRVAELSLEFGGGIASLDNLDNEADKSLDDQTDSIHVKSEQDEDEYDDHVDEFDVEAQMKKITGDDGDDYKEKLDTSSERDKSMDGIEGLMESSKEDSESDPEDRSVNHCRESSKTIKKDKNKLVNTISDTEERVFKEFECKNKCLTRVGEFDKADKSLKTEIKIEPHLIDKASLDSIEKELECSNNTMNTEELDKSLDNDSSKKDFKSTPILTPEESMMELDSMELPPEETPAEPAKVFSSIPPLSERIRKKVDVISAPKSRLDIDASIIESSLDLEIASSTQDGEAKEMLSTALRELLDAKIETDESTPGNVNKTPSENRLSVEPETNPVVPVEQTKIEEPIERSRVPSPVVTEQTDNKQPEIAPLNKKEDQSPPEIKRKDPRTVVPNKVTTPLKADGPPPIKRKLSITEYRKRKQQSTDTPLEPENSESMIEGKGTARGRSDSASSGTSSLSSDDEGAKAPLDIPSLSTLPIFANADTEEKKGTEDGTIGWSAAPTLVERQRENLTERLKREFGLFLNDDDEERVRKQALNNDPMLKTPIVSAPSSSTAGYPVAQLPPQPYIPPPGSASIHFTQYPPPAKPTVPPVVQYPSYPVPPPPIGTPTYPPPPIGKALPPTTTNQQFVVPQAPPGSNPYPPAQFSGPPPAVPAIVVVAPPVPVPPPATTSVSAVRFPPVQVQSLPLPLPQMQPQPQQQAPALAQPVLVYPVPPPPQAQPSKSFYSHSTPRS